MWSTTSLNSDANVFGVSTIRADSSIVMCDRDPTLLPALENLAHHLGIAPPVLDMSLICSRRDAVRFSQLFGPYNLALPQRYQVNRGILELLDRKAITVEDLDHSSLQRSRAGFSAATMQSIFLAIRNLPPGEIPLLRIGPEMGLYVSKHETSSTLTDEPGSRDVRGHPIVAQLGERFDLSVFQHIVADSNAATPLSADFTNSALFIHPSLLTLGSSEANALIDFARAVSGAGLRYAGLYRLNELAVSHCEALASAAEQGKIEALSSAFKSLSEQGWQTTHFLDAITRAKENHSAQLRFSQRWQPERRMETRAENSHKGVRAPVTAATTLFSPRMFQRVWDQRPRDLSRVSGVYGAARVAVRAFALAAGDNREAQLAAVIARQKTVKDEADALKDVLAPLHESRSLLVEQTRSKRFESAPKFLTELIKRVLHNTEDSERPQQIKQVQTLLAGIKPYLATLTRVQRQIDFIPTRTSLEAGQRAASLVTALGELTEATKKYRDAVEERIRVEAELRTLDSRIFELNSQAYGKRSELEALAAERKPLEAPLMQWKRIADSRTLIPSAFEVALIIQGSESEEAPTDAANSLLARRTLQRRLAQATVAELRLIGAISSVIDSNSSGDFLHEIQTNQRVISTIVGDQLSRMTPKSLGAHGITIVPSEAKLLAAAVSEAGGLDGRSKQYLIQALQEDRFELICLANREYHQPAMIVRSQGLSREFARAAANLWNDGSSSSIFQISAIALLTDRSFAEFGQLLETADSTRRAGIQASFERLLADESPDEFTSVFYNALRAGISSPNLRR